MTVEPRKLQQEWRHFFASYPATHAVTVAYNPAPDWTISLSRVRADLDKFHLYVDTALHGTYVTKWPEERRCSFIGMVEHPDTNAHVHMAWRVPARGHSEFDAAVARVWQRIHPSGTVCVRTNPDCGWARYILKNHWGAALENALLFVASRPARR